MAAMTLLLFTACTEELENYDREKQDNISFSLGEVADMTASRGTRGTSVTSALQISTFGVSAGVHSSGTYATNPCGNFFYCIEATPTVDTGYSWPTSEYTISFYAYYPYGNTNLTVSSSSGNGLPTYSYSVPQTVSTQADVMTAQILERSCSNTETVALTFGHRCSDIRFIAYNQQSDALTVKSISIYGVKYEGTWQSGTAWSLTGSANSSSSHPFTLSLNTNVASKATVDLTGTSDHFIMLPQTVATGTDMFVITTLEDSETRTYTYTLPSPLTWEMGKSYTYTLTLGNGTLTVNPVSVVDWEPISTVTNGFSVTDWQAQ